MTEDQPPDVVVVDDSQFMRTVITDVLENGGINVIARAANGREAIDTVAEHEPDVVTMDVEMPGMDGIEAVKRLMQNDPIPILMLSAHTDSDAESTFEALERGAVDVFTKPGGEVSIEIQQFQEQLVRKVRSVAAVDVDAVSRGDADSQPSPSSAPASFVGNPTAIIGSSTGGPKIVEQLLAGLPRSAELRLLVIQHMPDEFTGRFAERLDDHSEYDIREAGDGERLAGGEGAVAPGGSHLEIAGEEDGQLRLALSKEAPAHGVRPAIDVTMRDAAETISDPLVAVVLTGMGADGAAGAHRIKDAGGTVIAQDEATSAVFGMPKKTIERGCVDAVLPAGEISRGIVDAITESEVREVTDP